MCVQLHTLYIRKKKKNFNLPWTWPVSCFLSCVRLNSLFIENSKQLTAGTMILQWKREHNNLKKPEHRREGLRQGRSGVSSTKPTETKWNYRKIGEKKVYGLPCSGRVTGGSNGMTRRKKGIKNFTNIGDKLEISKLKKKCILKQKRLFFYCFIFGPKTCFYDCETLDLISNLVRQEI